MCKINKRIGQSERRLDVHDVYLEEHEKRLNNTEPLIIEISMKWKILSVVLKTICIPISLLLIYEIVAILLK